MTARGDVDYPVGEAGPVGFVSRCRTLAPSDVERIVGGTLAGLLGLTAVSDGLGVAQGQHARSR